MVLFQDAEVHHHKEACLARLLRGFFIDDLFLHPDGRYAELDRVVDNFLDEFRAAEDVDDIDLLRNIAQRSIRLLAEDFLNIWIDRDDLVAVALHIR